MTGIETITLTISIVSLSISVVAAYKSYRFEQYQLRLNTRKQFQPFLVDTNRAIIEHPELSAFYDSSSIPSDLLNNPIERARVEAYAHMLLNVLESVFGFYGNSMRLTKEERVSFESWKDYLRDTLERSSLARELWSKPNIQSIYNPTLVAEIESVITSIVLTNSTSPNDVR
jgi:hypothetical protein